MHVCDKEDSMGTWQEMALGLLIATAILAIPVIVADIMVRGKDR